MNADPHTMTTTLPSAESGWRAHLQLRFAHQETRTVLAQRQHIGPLLVQKPFYPEGEVCHVYLIHPPGGVVGGDELRLSVKTDEAAHALITTPAATKFYRAAPGQVARVEQCLQLSSSRLEWLPQESIFFDGAAVSMRTRIELDGWSSFIGWELALYGRQAGNEPFRTGRVHQALELWCDGKPLLLDHLHVHAGELMQQAAWGLQGQTALGSLLAFPAITADVDAVREMAVDLDSQVMLSVTLVDKVLLCRCLCDDGALLKASLLKVWQCLRPRLMQRDAVMPRIWAT